MDITGIILSMVLLFAAPAVIIVYSAMCMNKERKRKKIEERRKEIEWQKYISICDDPTYIF